MQVRGKQVLGSVVRDRVGGLETRNKVPRALAFVRGGSTHRKAAIRAARAAGLVADVVQTLCGSTDDGSYLDVRGPAALLGPFLDGPLVDDWDWCMDARPPRGSRAPGILDNRRPAFLSSLPKPAPAVPREVRAKWASAKRAAFAAQDRRDAGRPAVDPSATVGSFRGAVAVEDRADRFFLYANGTPFLGGRTVADVVRKAQAANLPDGAEFSIVGADGVAVEM